MTPAEKKKLIKEVKATLKCTNAGLAKLTRWSKSAIDKASATGAMTERMVDKLTDLLKENAYLRDMSNEGYRTNPIFDCHEHIRAWHKARGEDVTKAHWLLEELRKRYPITEPDS